MAGEVSASILSLEQLSSSLADTLPMLDRLRDENEALILRMQEKINLVLDDYTSRKNIAYDRYQQELEALDYAERTYEDVPYSSYRAVAETEEAYDQLSHCCSRINKIKDEFTVISAQYKKQMVECSSAYSTILRKGDSFIGKYIELLQISQSALSDGTGGIPTTSEGASISNIGNGLTVTNQTWKLNGDGATTFNAPMETGKMLDSNQGKEKGFGGTCGLVSCVNVLIMAGINATEQQVVSYASSHGLCKKGRTNPDNNGGTDPAERQAVLAHFGVRSELQSANVENIANAVSEGRGVIAAFDAGLLYDDLRYYGNGHAVTITSVKKGANGNILGFYVCDSGTGGRDSSKYYSADQIRLALRPGRPINVTSVIR